MASSSLPSSSNDEYLVEGDIVDEYLVEEANGTLHVVRGSDGEQIAEYEELEEEHENDPLVLVDGEVQMEVPYEEEAETGGVSYLQRDRRKSESSPQKEIKAIPNDPVRAVYDVNHGFILEGLPPFTPRYDDSGNPIIHFEPAVDKISLPTDMFELAKGFVTVYGVPIQISDNMCIYRCPGCHKFVSRTTYYRHIHEKCGQDQKSSAPAAGELEEESIEQLSVEIVRAKIQEDMEMARNGTINIGFGVYCPLCGERTKNAEALCVHAALQHHLPTKSHACCVRNMDEFFLLKESLEQEQGMLKQYVNKKGFMHYRCSLVNYSKPPHMRGTGSGSFRSKKVFVECTAFLKARINPTGNITVAYCNVHSHPTTGLRRVKCGRLPRGDRERIAYLIKEGFNDRDVVDIMKRSSPTMSQSELVNLERRSIVLDETYVQKMRYQMGASVRRLDQYDMRHGHRRVDEQALQEHQENLARMEEDARMEMEAEAREEERHEEYEQEYEESIDMNMTEANESTGTMSEYMERRPSSQLNDVDSRVVERSMDATEILDEEESYIDGDEYEEEVVEIEEEVYDRNDLRKTLDVIKAALDLERGGCSEGLTEVLNWVQDMMGRSVESRVRFQLEKNQQQSQKESESRRENKFIKEQSVGRSPIRSINEKDKRKAAMLDSEASTSVEPTIEVDVLNEEADEDEKEIESKMAPTSRSSKRIASVDVEDMPSTSTITTPAKRTRSVIETTVVKKPPVKNTGNLEPATSKEKASEGKSELSTPTKKSRASSSKEVTTPTPATNEKSKSGETPRRSRRL